MVTNQRTSLLCTYMDTVSPPPTIRTIRMSNCYNTTNDNKCKKMEEIKKNLEVDSKTFPNSWHLTV